MAEPNVGLMADTVSTRADIERLLTLHCRHPSRRRDRQQRVASSPRADVAQ
jgi:hypothetical protein